MSGHSKWANIQHRKNRQDAKKAKVFTRVAKEIAVSARLGGGDPDGNPRLRAAILEARSYNIPADNIQRAIDKGIGDLAADAIEEVIYEGYGPGGVAILVEGVTDNRNRTASEMRSLFSRAGGSLAESGSVAWQFERKSLLTVAKEGLSEDRLTLLLLEAGGEDYEDGEDVWVVTAAGADLHAVSEALTTRGAEVRSAEWVMVPTAGIAPTPEATQQVLDLLEKLDDHDDVQDVWSNLDSSLVETAVS